MINIDDWVKIVDNQTNKVIAAGKVTKRKDNYVDFSDINKTAKTIEKYFDNNNGMCD